MNAEVGKKRKPNTNLVTKMYIYFIAKWYVIYFSNKRSLNSHIGLYICYNTNNASLYLSTILYNIHIKLKYVTINLCIYSSEYAEYHIMKYTERCATVGGEVDWLLEKLSWAIKSVFQQVQIQWKGSLSMILNLCSWPQGLTFNGYIHYESQQRIILWGSIKHGIHTCSGVIMNLFM